MGKSPTRWVFFVDESGNFEDDGSDVVVGGLLVQESLVGLEPRHLQRALRAAAPALPWPLHTAELNLPIVFALEALCNGSTDPEAGATALVLSEQEALTNEALDELRNGRWPGWDKLRVLDQLLQHRSRKLYGRWRSRMLEVRAAIGAVLETLMGTEAAPKAAVVVAGETVRAETDTKTRYRGLLTIAIERALHVVTLHPGQHDVRLSVLTRHIVDETLQMKVPLHARHLGKMVAEMKIDRARAIPLEVSEWADGMHPALMAADFVTNRARPRLAENQALHQVEAFLLESLRVPIRTDGHSHLAASGAALQYVKDVAAGKAPVPLSAPEFRRWACEQAREWAGSPHG